MKLNIIDNHIKYEIVCPFAMAISIVRLQPSCIHDWLLHGNIKNYATTSE